MTAEVFGWLGDAARGLISVFPQRRIIKAGHAGMRYGPRGGLVLLEPGLHWIWPLIHQFDEFPVCGQTSKVEKQPLVTKCGKSLTGGAVIRYSVRDTERFCVDNYNTFDDIAVVAQVAVCRVVVLFTWEELKAKPKLVDQCARSIAQRDLTAYGVEVHYLKLKGVAPAQLLHVITEGTAPASVVQPQEASE